MMNNFFDFKEIGSLKLDKIFFESYYPILFTCLNEKNDVFLCVCCQADLNVRKWLITDVSPKTVIELLSNKITIRDSFLKDRGSKYTIIYNMENKNFQIEENNIEDWDEEKSIDLPTSGEYMDAEEDEFLEEIEYYKDMGIHYKGYKEQEIVKITKKEILYKEDSNINVYKNGSYSVKYTIGNMEELKNNQFYKVLCNIIKEKIFIDSIEKIFEDNHNSSFASIKSEHSLLTSLDTKEEFCINDNASNFIKAA